MGYSPRRLKRLLRGAGFVEITRFHNNRKRLFTNSPREIAAHIAEPLVLPGARPLLDADLAARYGAVASEAA